MPTILFILVVFVITAVRVVLTALTKYPATETQLLILKNILLVIDGEIALWGLRVVTLFILFLALYFFYGICCQKKICQNIILMAILFIIASPTFWVLWLSLPLVCLKMFLLALFAYLCLVKRKKVLVVFPLVLIILWSLFVSREKAVIFHKLGLADATKEVEERFFREDDLFVRVEFPLVFRRAVYNKYFFFYKQIMTEVLPFLDIETVFYQEVHPMEQKSVVLFFWPQFFLFIFGVLVLVTQKEKQLKRAVLICVLLAWFNYTFSSGAAFVRFGLVLVPVALVLAIAVDRLVYLSKRKFGMAGLTLAILSGLTVYGFMANCFDTAQRIDYWLDNRPLAYDFVYKKIKTIDISTYEKVQVSSLVGDAKRYCYFYFGEECNTEKFSFGAFDFGEDEAETGIYAGFVGEFIGPHVKNELPEQWLDIMKGKGWDIVGNINLRDTIAYKFGNDLVVAIKP